ncbi:MAG: TetR/AcrR family transcriptional regulator [Propionibacteriales bacterium]|nr:TetR/AcrR family transcriptional regulator [Propionibacteriales bacterium]
MTGMSVAPAAARERLVATSYDLFARRGIRGVGVNEIISTAKVAKATFYNHFRTKDDLVLAFLERREETWVYGLVVDGIRVRADNPEDQLLAIFDVFDDWFGRPEEFEACSFVNILLEMGPGHPLGQACLRYLGDLRQVLNDLATSAGLRDPEEFAWSWHILMKGSIVAAAEGDLRAAKRAKDMGRDLIQRFRIN